MTNLDADVARTPPSRPPMGWYPDPGGTRQWRRWDGTTWSDATMPFGPPPPDEWTLARARAAWAYLRPLAPWAIAAPALGAITVAAQSATFAPLRVWFHAYLQAVAHHHATPALPSVATTSTSLAITITNYAVFFATIFGLVGWLRFSVSSMRVATSARYPRRHNAAATSLAMLVPFLGPIMAWLASRDCLPTGHEARRALGLGWSLVGLGELGTAAIYLTVLSTSSALAAWAAAAACAAVWVAAAIKLPIGLEAIADDHASLGVHLRAAPP
ncbi:MAG TPA: DUF2510 domain-containing protein [Acidimicrobiales bacterium]|jgi:hypothetical protein|nr:DUF2510 domain-containing protein [Acidimicrobiales bacterium]